MQYFLKSGPPGKNQILYNFKNVLRLKGFEIPFSGNNCVFSTEVNSFYCLLRRSEEFFLFRTFKQPSFFSIRLKNRNVIIGPEMVIVKKESQYPHFENECPCPQNKNKEEL
jgi:hypothetical protein